MIHFRFLRLFLLIGLRLIEGKCFSFDTQVITSLKYHLIILHQALSVDLQFLFSC